ncbi:MAG: hypothetical protein DLD55_02255 [candidate division SR1 bacterium]|nr:MAG: hypothetical protein DLD55_02255 [candidate division SR1 bacterium]
MKHNGFEVKVSDILNGKITDTLLLEKKMIPSLSALTDEGVSGEVGIQSLDRESLLVTLNVEAKLKDVCDRCGVNFQREIKIENYSAKYVCQLDPEGKDIEEDILLIDTKNGVIDLEELIYHAIILQEPIVKVCLACKEVIENDENNEDDETQRAIFSGYFS